MTYIINADNGSTTGIQSQGNITYSLGNNLRATNISILAKTQDISDISGIFDERFDDVDYTGGIPTVDIQNSTGNYASNQYLGRVVYLVSNDNVTDNDFTYKSKTISSITGLYSNRFDDETYYD